MPKLSGRDLISDITEKYSRRLMAVSYLVILIKAYDVALGDLVVFGVMFPERLFDVVALSLIAYFCYALMINWGGDLVAFRLWFDGNNIMSEFGTEMKTDKSFISGGAGLIKKLYALEKGRRWPDDFNEVEPELKRDYQNFKANVELYSVRLDAVGRKFRALSLYGRFYVWIQSFVLPIGIALLALCFLLGIYRL